MSKPTFASLKLKQNTDVNTFKIGDTEVEVLKYLPVSDKIDLVQISLQQSLEDGVYNEIKLNTYFYLYIVYFYTNINFTDKQKEDPFKLYDILAGNGIIDLVLDAMDKEEYKDLYDFLIQSKKNELEYKTTTAYLISNLITNLPQQMSQVSEIIDNFNPEKYKAVQDFARAANGGRDIVTNLPVKEVKKSE